MNELISVVVPVYNVETYLPNCMEKLVDQTYKEIEIILVDDGSTDSSSIMCDKYAQQDKRIKVIHKKNGGLSDARNAGIKASKGEFITLVDSDDIVSIDYCEKLYRAMKTHEADIAICKTVLFCKVIPAIKGDIEPQIVINDEIVKNYLLGKIRPTAWGKIYKKSLFNSIEYPCGKTTEDVYVIVELLLKCKKIVYDIDTNYYYRQRSDSIQYSHNINTHYVLEAHKHNYELLQNSQHRQLAYDRYILSFQDALNLLIRSKIDDERIGEYTNVLRQNKRIILSSDICDKKRRFMLRLLLFSNSLYKQIYLFHFNRLLSNLS